MKNVRLLQRLLFLQVGAVFRLASLLLCFVAASSQAQRLAPDPVLNGMVIWAAAPDPSGWVWLATDRGGFRYDGQHLVSLRELTTAGPRLGADRLTAVLRDSTGTVWWGGATGLWAFQPASGHLQAVPLPGVRPSWPGTTALGQHGGRLWVGLNADPWVVLSVDLRHPVGSARREMSFPRGYVEDFASDAQGRWLVLGRQEHWTLTATGRWLHQPLARPFHGRFVPAQGPSRWVPNGARLPLPGTGGRWLLAADGLYHVEPGHAQALTRVQPWTPPNPETPRVLRLVERDSTWYWSAGPLVLSVSLRGLQAGSLPLVRSRLAPLPFGRELELVPLPDGVSLLGFRRDAPGAVRVAPDTRAVEPLPAMPAQALSTRAFGRLPDGRLFVSSYEGLFTQAANSPQAPLRRLAPTAQAGVWFATLPLPGKRLLVANELGQFDLWEHGQQRRLPWTGPHPRLYETNGLCLLRDHAGRYWGGSVAGLFELDVAGRQVRRYREADTSFVLHRRRIEALAEGPAGMLWVATSQGLYRLTVATGELQRYGSNEPAPRNLPTADIRCLAFTHPDSLWLGTFDQGLLLLDPRRGLRLQVSRGQGLPHESVASLARVSADPHALWLGTYHGVVRYAPAHGTVRVLTAADGLVAEGCNRQSLWFEAATGQLYVGGVGGASRLSPHQLGTGQRPQWPALLLAALRQHHVATGRTTTQYPAPGQHPLLRLAPGDAYIDLELALTDFTPGAQPRYAYRLVPAGKGPPRWLWLGTARTVHLQQLAAGSYTLQVHAETAAGIPAAAPLTLRVEVEQPWPRRPGTWALGALVLAGSVGAVVYGWQRVRVGRVRAEQQLRARLAADLHDEVGNLLARVTMRAELAREVPDPQFLDELLSESRAAATSVRDLIWTVDAAADTAGALADRLQDLLAHSAHAAGRPAHFARQPTPFPAEAALRPDVRQHAYLIGREALTNALKHAPPRAALHLNLDVTAAALQLDVWQEGTGAAPTVPAARAGQGLRNMHARARQLGGTLTACGPTPDGGWQVSLHVPSPLGQR